MSGTQTPTLTLTDVAQADEGGYSVIISNRFGSVTSLVATLTVVDPFIASQPASLNVDAGDPVEFSVAALGSAPLEYQWRKNGADIVGETSGSLIRTHVQGADAGSYDVVVGNPFGTLTSSVALLTVNLAGPDTFNPSADHLVSTTAFQADGKIVVGGSFTTLGGQPHNRIGRLNADGSLDTTFNPGASGDVNCLAVQPDGKILVSGAFGSLCGQTRFCIGRLNSDGSLDTDFNSGATGSRTAWCRRRMGRSWWAARSTGSGGRLAPILAGSMPMAPWTPLSALRSGEPCIRSPCRRTERFLWAARRSRGLGIPATAWAGLMTTARSI